jgi:hypothetical protein
MVDRENRENQNQQGAVMDLVDDAVLAGPDSPLPVAADELLGPEGSRLAGQEFDRRLDSPART